MVAAKPNENEIHWYKDLRRTKAVSHRLPTSSGDLPELKVESSVILLRQL